MRAIITVTEMSSLPGRYVIKCDALRSRRGFVPTFDVRGEQAAAAKALEYAVRIGSRGYAIIAPVQVAVCIPIDMRERA